MRWKEWDRNGHRRTILGLVESVIVLGGYQTEMKWNVMSNTRRRWWYEANQQEPTNSMLMTMTMTTMMHRAIPKFYEKYSHTHRLRHIDTATLRYARFYAWYERIPCVTKFKRHTFQMLIYRIYRSIMTSSWFLLPSLPSAHWMHKYVYTVKPALAFALATVAVTWWQWTVIARFCQSIRIRIENAAPQIVDFSMFFSSSFSAFASSSSFFHCYTKLLVL